MNRKSNGNFYKRTEWPQYFKVSWSDCKKLSLNEIWRMLFLMIPSYEGVKGNIWKINHWWNAIDGTFVFLCGRCWRPAASSEEGEFGEWHAGSPRQSNHRKSSMVLNIRYLSLSLFWLTEVWLFWLHWLACGILVPWPGIKLTSPFWKHRVLTAGPPGKCILSHVWLFVTS